MKSVYLVFEFVTFCVMMKVTIQVETQGSWESWCERDNESQRVSFRGVVGMMLWQVCKLDTRCLFLYLETTTPSVHTPHTRSLTAFLFPFLKITTFVLCLWTSRSLKLFALICPLLTSHVPSGSSELAWTMTCQSQLGLDWFLLTTCLTDSLVHFFSQWMI